MSNKLQTEVLVVGAGPVGMMAALLLTQNGIKTRIIDQEARTAGHSYSCALHPRTLSLLHQVGVVYDALELGHRVYSVGFYEGKERQAEVKLSALPVEFPFALVLEQSTLENLLEQKLRQAGVRIDWNHRLANLEMDDTGATAVIEQLGMTGKGYGVPDFDLDVKDSSEARANFIIGADGPKSLVRSQLGLRFQNAGAPQHFQVYEVEAEDVHTHEARVVLDHTTAVMWPLSTSRCRWSFQINPNPTHEDFPRKDRDRIVLVERPGEQIHLHELQYLLNTHASWCQTSIKEVVWATDVQFERRLVRHFGRDAGWLAGDAAHQTGPVGMQSMNIGFREAANLVEALKRILRKDGSKDLLRNYGRVHRAEWQQLLGFEAGEAAAEKASPWVRQRAFRIVGSIPASGADLVFLLQQLGIHFRPEVPAEVISA